MRDLLDPIYAWIDQHDKFCLKDLIPLLSPEHLSNVEVLIELRENLFKDRRYFYYKGCFHRKDLFFNNSTFLVQPTVQEWSNGILVPGHRWIPFVSSTLKPWDVTLLDPMGKPLNKEIHALEMESVKIFHLLLGEEQIFTDCQVKSDLFGRFHAEFPQYDLSPILSLKTEQSSQLRCRVIDYNQGILQIEGLEPLRDDLHWHMALEEGFNRVFEEFEMGLTLPEQIEWAFFLGQKTLLSNPGSSLAHSVQKNPRLSFYRIGLNTLLWRNDGSVHRIIENSLKQGSPRLFMHEGEEFLNRMEELFNSMGPFKENAMKDIKELILNYAKDYQRCMNQVNEHAFKPMGKEMQILLTISQYSHCLYGYVGNLIEKPPSKEEKQRIIELILETEGLLQNVEPYIRNCRIPKP